MSLLGNIWVKLGLKSDDFQRGMDNAEKRSKTFGETMRGITTKVMAAVAAFKMLAGTLKTITNFEAAQSKLAAVLGTTTDKMQRLTDSAIELGRKTQYTASEVTGLQTELAKLGFAEPEILSMQEAVLKFAAAVGTDLPSAAARAGATMRGFGLTAEETSHMLEVMAVSTSKSALSFNYLDSTLGKLVPVTRSFGLNTEATISLLGTLANAGIDASSAGTALRNILIQLSDKSSKLNAAIGKQPQTMEELIEAFQTLRDKHIDLGQAQELVDKRSASVLLSLMNNADACRELYGELNNTDGALDEMYDTMTHNVAGAVKEVQSAWEGFVLSLRGSTGILYTVLTNVRDLIGELNYAMFMGTKQSTETANAYDKLKRTIAETADPVAALDIAYKQLLADANAEVGRLEDKSALGRLLNHESLDEARAKVDGLQAAYKQLRGELTKKGNATQTVIEQTEEQTEVERLLAEEAAKRAKEEAEAHTGIINQLKDEISAKEKLRDMSSDRTEIARLNEEIRLLKEKQALLLGTGKRSVPGGELQKIDSSKLFNNQGGETTIGLRVDTSGLKHSEEEIDAFVDKFKAQQERAEDIAYDFGNALRQGVISAIDELAEAIGTGDWDTSALVKALLSPIADACISAGTMILSTGEAVEAFKSALESLNGYAALAAGAALIAVGTAAKIGLAALAKGSRSGTAGGHTEYSYTGGYGVTPAAVSSVGPMEIEGTVTVKGQDIQIALDNYNRNRRR